MPILAVANQKGGVGKTTTVVNLGAALNERGYRVLLVDDDPQANLALALGVPDPEALTPSLGDLLMEHAHNRARSTAFDAIVATPAGLDLLPSNTRLSAAELVLAGAIGREMVMRDILAPVLDSYDYVIIDCLPSLGLLAINALTAANAILIPVQADYLALQGVAQMLETVGAVRAKLNPDLAVLGALLTMMDVRTAHARGVASMLREALDGQVRVFDVEIRTQVALKDSVQEGRPILDFRGDSQAAQAYRQLADEVLESLSPRAAERSSPPRPASPLNVELDQDRGVDLREPSWSTAAAYSEEPDAVEHSWYAANPGSAAVVASGAEQVAASSWADPDSYPDASAGGDLTFPALYPDPAAIADDCAPEGVEQPDVLPVPALSRFGTFLNGREAWLGRGSGQ